MYIFEQLEENITKDNVFMFYAMTFALGVVKPMVMLSVIPELATWPYRQEKLKTQ